MKKFVFTVFSIVPLIILLIGYAFAVPSDPPPTGKVWVESAGSWILVIAPPGDGPYIWRDGEWVLDTSTPPANSQWVPGHWVSGHWKGSKWIPGHWVAGHWKAVTTSSSGAKWIPGYWKGNKWIPGHWSGTPPHKKMWVPGHRRPGGRWIPGHWK